MKSEFGLLIKDEENTGEFIPLLGVKAEGEIMGRGTRVRVFQRFKNEESKPVEAIYKFPLPEGAAICGFKAHIDDRVIEGKVEEREKAFEIYDKALIEGHGGYLLDEERPNIFTLSVGNLNPGSEVLVEIEYVTLLDSDGATVRFFLPTSISPRYIPDGIKDDSGIPENEKLHPLYVTDVPYGLSISLKIHGTGQLKSVESPSHHIRIENIKDDQITISFSSGEARMDRDFVLNIAYQEAFKTRAYHCRFENESFLQLDLMLDHGETPRGATKEVQRDIWFVLDCSGSMQGDSIEQAKRALEVCLRGLQQGVRFSLCRFGSSHEFLFKEPKPYSECTLSKAIAYLRKIDADLGGTEILKPLKAICSNGNESRQDIILLTDGEVGNEHEVFKLIREHRSYTRVFPVGIGAGCNEHFIKGLARAGNGSSELIHPGERIEPKVLSIFGKLSQAGLENALITWGALQVEQAPFAPAIFLGSPVTLFARSTAGNSTGNEVVVKGKVNGTEREWKIPVLDAPNADLPLSILWARERIRDLEESDGAIQTRGSQQEIRKKESRDKTILEISKRFGILSQSTSYVAVEQREERERTTGELTLRKIPTLVTIGWHGRGGAIDYCRGSSVSFAKQEPSTRLNLDIPTFRHASEFEQGVSVAEHRVLKVRDNKMDLILHILSLQRAGGGIEMDEKLLKYLNLRLDNLQNMAMLIQSSLRVDKVLLLSTAILLSILELHYGDVPEMWTAMVRKSKDWLNDVIKKSNPRIRGRDLRIWVKEFVELVIST